MEGAGNDFVVLDATRAPFALTAAELRRLADRHFGVGCDQVLVVGPAQDARNDFGYRIFNADGGEVEQCGNGARCFVRFVHDKGLTGRREIRVETRSGVIAPRLREDGLVTVDMGVPALDPAEVPFVSDSDAVVQPLEVGGDTIAITAVSMGNPHAVQVVADVATAPVAERGALIERHPRFPARVNAGFMEVVTPRHIRLRVFERGVGETLACGTGACAAVAVGRRHGRLDATVEVELPGGKLEITWAAPGEHIWMKGPTAVSFTGRVDI